MMSATTNAQAAAAIGRELNAYVRATEARDLDGARIVGLVERLAVAPCETPADVLALIAVADEVCRMALVAFEDAPETFPNALGWVGILHRRVITVLEGASGVTAAGFTGCGPTAH